MTAARSVPSPSIGAGGVSTGSTLYSLQVLRGLAATAVAFYHTHVIFSQPEYGGIDLWGAVTSKGWMGVNFFFVLSGFIIMYAHARDIGQPARAGRYGWRRFSRVYPVYWLYLTAYIAAAYVGIGHPDFSWEGEHMLSAYLLLQIVPVPSFPLQPAWTLVYEVGFYIVFTTLILNRRIGQVVIGVWAAAILINGLILKNTAFGPLHMWNIYFLFGGAVYLAFKRADSRWSLPILISGFVILAAILSTGVVDSRLGLTDKKPFVLFILAIPFGLILLGSAMSERRFGWKPPALLLLLGDASYSLYLVHSPILSVLALLNHRLLPGVFPAFVVFLTAVVISVFAGVVAHIACERPLLAWARHIGRGSERNGVVLQKEAAS